MSRPIADIVAGLLGPLLAARPGPSQWRLLSWDADQGITLALGRGEQVLWVELGARDEARPCYARTRRFNVVARPAFSAPGALDDDARRAVDRLIVLLRARESALPLIARAPGARGAAVREIEVEHVLVAEGRGHYHVNPYVGCMVGCAFCFAGPDADFSRALEGLPALPWGRWVDVKVNAPAVLRRELAEHAPGVVRLSPVVTDPYQPLERRYRVTRGCLEALVDAGFTPVVLTREARVVDDLPILARSPRAAVGLSIPTDDDAVRAAFEPRAAPIDTRLDALARCHAAGVRTFAVVQPVLPLDPARLVARLAPFVHAVRIDRMHALPLARPLYERAGRLDALTDDFFARTQRALRDGFRARGVAVDEGDDLAAALGLA